MACSPGDAAPCHPHRARNQRTANKTAPRNPSSHQFIQCPHAIRPPSSFGLSGVSAIRSTIPFWDL